LAVCRDRIVRTVDSLRAEIAEPNLWLHDHPELSGAEHESARRLAARAAEHGFAVDHAVGGLATSFRAVRRGRAPGRRVAYLAEYDALPVVGHGCGHNMIGAAGTYAAIALGSVIGDVAGEVALFGTPEEETDGGKITMLEAGVFDGVSAALMVHPGIETEIAYSSLACICPAIEFFGHSAHAAASPWKGVNALDAMIQLFVARDQLLKAMPGTVKMPGVITHGGDRANMVPDHTRAEFSIRGRDKAEAEMVYARLLDCARAAAAAIGARMEHRVEGNVYFDMRPDPALVALYRANWLAVGGEQPVVPDITPHGSLDIANLSHRFPCLHPSFSITKDKSIGGHTHEFCAATVTPFAAEQLVKAIKSLALTGLEVLAGGSAESSDPGI
jgi:amidohydrolase